MIQLHDKIFEPYLSELQIQEIIKEMAHKMGILKDEKPLFIIILKGSFIFASDLVKALDYDVVKSKTLWEFLSKLKDEH